MVAPTNESTTSTLMSDLGMRVKRSLRELSYRQLEAVDCLAEDGNQITLTGQLRSYYLKQIAQTIALKVPGVRGVKNDIMVLE